MQPHLLRARGLAPGPPVPRRASLPRLHAPHRRASVFGPRPPPTDLAGTAAAADLRSPPLRFLAAGGAAEPAKGPGPGPASLQAASPPGEGEAPVAAAAAPPSPEALTGALLALFSAGDLGKKLYSVLCRDIATVGEAQPLSRTERLNARHLPRGACWRETWGEARSAGGTLAAAANQQAPGLARAASRAVLVRPRPLGAPGDVVRGGAGRPRGTAARAAPCPTPRGGNGCAPGALAPGGGPGRDWNSAAVCAGCTHRVSPAAPRRGRAEGARMAALAEKRRPAPAGKVLGRGASAKEPENKGSRL